MRSIVPAETVACTSLRSLARARYADPHNSLREPRQSLSTRLRIPHGPRSGDMDADHGHSHVAMTQEFLDQKAVDRNAENARVSTRDVI